MMLLSKQISGATRIAQTPGNLVSDMDGEKVMLNIENGKYYNLGKQGGVIWAFIEHPITIDSLIEYLLTEYEIDRSQCEQQVLNFINSLYKEGLIQID